ncbi:MAG: hypothetical protein NTU49_10980, partial [Gammaproteobacteria bacterium]|nr:hypothetical protein [Gammaproteobacteria bacterium]
KIRCFKANAATVTLETLLISMFVNSGSINFTDAEYTKMLEDKDKPGFIECTDDFEQQFTSLINDNPEFLNIPLPGKEEEFKNWRETADSKALDDLEKNFQAALMSRPALLGYNDPECIIGHFCFEIMVKDFFDQALLEKNIVALAETVKNIEEFTCALMMLEKRHWKLFLTQLNATLAKIFPPDSETKSVFYFFFHFPEENWTTFFETLKKLGRNRLLNTYQLGSLLNVLPESKWTVLNEAVYPLLHHLFFSFKDVALFFSAVPLVGWAKSVGLFREQIEKVLKKELNFISILFILPHDNWPFFCEIFKKALSEALQEGDQLENFFFQINYDYKFAFFESILPVFIDLPPGFLARAFKLLSKDAWTDAFLLFKEEQFKALSKDIVSMTDFLNDFEKNDRVHILKCLLVYKEKISIEFNVVKQLAIKFPECKDELLFSIESQLPKIISDALFILANYDFPLRLDYSLSETVEPAILVDLQSFESMQFAFSFLDASNRFYFFAFFSQNIVILSLRDVSLLLQSLEQSFWKDAIDLLELEKLNLVLQNESDLRNLLNHFEKTDRIACLNALHIIFPLFEINASSFCFLLKEFPECESALPCIFIKNIPGMFLKMFAEFLGFDKDDFPISECLKNEFNFIVEKTLPFLLRSQSIMLFCPSFLRASNQRHSFLLGDEAVYNFYKEIKMIESTFFNDAISLLSAIKKLQILKNFMIETKEKRIPETTFYAELVKNFGENFFVPLDDYIKRFQAESFVSVVSSVSFVRRAAAAIAPERAHHERMPSL